MIIWYKGDQRVTIRPFKAMWDNAVDGVPGSQKAICQRYVLAKLRGVYPTYNFSFVSWEDFTYEVKAEFTAPVRRNQPPASALRSVKPARPAKVPDDDVAAVFASAAHGTDDGDPNCRCDTRFRCSVHDA